MAVEAADIDGCEELLVARDGFRSAWLDDPQPDRGYRIELTSGLAAVFHCRLESGKPLSNVRITLSRAVIPDTSSASAWLSGADTPTMAASAISDSNGLVAFSGLVAGDYAVHALHDHAVVVDGDDSVRIAGAAEPSHALTFARPSGIVLELVGDRIVTNDVSARDCKLTGRGPAFLRALARRALRPYSDAKRFVTFIGLRANENASAVVTIWTESGHLLRLERRLVDLGPEFEPEKIEVHADAEKLPVGTVQIVPVVGNETMERLTGELFLRPERTYSPSITLSPDGPVTVPAGTYLLTSQAAELRRAVGRVFVTVREGEAIEQVVQLGCRPIECEWVVLLEDGNTFRSGVLVVTREGGGPVRRGLAFPEGRLWLCESETYRFSFLVGNYRLEQAVVAQRSDGGLHREFVLTCPD